MALPSDAEGRKTWRSAIIGVLGSTGEPLHYEEIARRVLEAGFETAGKTPEKTVSKELTTHPQLFTKVAEGTYTLAEPLDIEPPTSLLESAAIAGQGLQPDSGIRRLIELHAMRSATTYFERLEWTVSDVSGSRPFDLLCARPRGEMLSVEVKGTATEGHQVLLTRNEVSFAKTHYPHVALFILSRVIILNEGNAMFATGGHARVFNPWDISDGLLTPISYSYAPGA